MNPSRGVLAALLCALLGASAAAHPGRGAHPSAAASPEAGSTFVIPNGPCAGRGASAPAPVLAGPAYDLRAHPLEAGVLEQWKRVGYSVNASSSQILFPSGRPVPAAEFERLSAPFDAAQETMTNGSWSALIFSGYRLDDATCRLLDPEKRTPLTRLDMLDLEHQIGGGRNGAALEELVVALKQADPALPPPPAVLARMKELEGRGESLPETLRLALHNPALTAGALRGQAESAYASQLRAWDGTRDLKALAEGALPPVAGYNIPAVRRGRIEPWENVIGDGFSADVQALFSRTESGRELLGRFKDKAGNPDLPKVTVLKMSQRPNDAGYGAASAVYDDSSRTVILSHWYVVGQILAGAKPAEREELGRRLSDSKALAEYLRAHPERRLAVADRVDVTMFHELTHAWQYRRQALGVEALRGNAPSGIVLAHEHEAFFGMDRYLHEKLMNDPSAALRSADFEGYLSLMNDPVKYRDQITRTYQQGIAASTDFKTLEQVQAERRRILGVPAAGGLVGWTRALLERAGLARGSEALKQAGDDQAATEKRYLDQIVPRMRAESLKTLPDAFRALQRPDLGLKVLAVVPNADPRAADRRPEFAAAAAAMLVRPPAAVSLDERLGAFSAIYAEFSREKKAVPPEVMAAYGRDVLAFVARAADQAEAERDPERRKALLLTARQWLAALPINDPQVVPVARRLAVLEKAR